MVTSIVIIDNDPEDIEFLRDAFEQFDPSIKCTCFTSPLDAIQYISNDDELLPGIICVDYDMPGVNGAECITLLRSIPKLRNSKLVGNSTSMDELLEQRMRAHGASQVFKKPDDFKGYHRVIANILKKLEPASVGS